MGAKISKGYSFYTSQPKVLKLVMNFPPNGSHKSTFGIFDFLTVKDFFFENFKFTIAAYSEIKNLNYLGNKRS